MNKNIVLPCNIGDEIYIVEDYNEHYDDFYHYYETIYGGRVVVKELIVDSFIVDSQGVFIAENGYDGYNKITTYHDLTLEEYDDCKIFYSEKDAMDFIKTIKK